MTVGASTLCPRCVFDLALTAGSVAGPDAEGGPAAADLQTLFADFEVQAPIARGGMGIVYRARDLQTGSMVALKVLLPELADDPAFTERFEREARVLRKLNHPNIVGLDDYGHRGDLFYLTMELVDGPNLREFLAANRLTTRRALTIARQVCEGLEYAHAQGVVHRDLKPANILMDDSGCARIADFGLARLLGKSAPDLSLTLTNQVIGTPHYMAPEQVHTPGQVDHRADLYALGVLLYEMLTRELPIGRFQPPSVRCPESRGCDTLVMKLLENDPRLRYQKASEVKEELSMALLRVMAMQGDPRPRSASPAKVVVQAPRSSQWLRPEPVRRRRSAQRMPMFVALAVTVLVIGGMWMLGQQGSSANAGSVSSPSNPTREDASRPNLAEVAIAEYLTFDPALPASGTLELPGALRVRLHVPRHLESKRTVTLLLRPTDPSWVDVETKLVLGANALAAAGGRYRVCVQCKEGDAVYEAVLGTEMCFVGSDPLPEVVVETEVDCDILMQSYDICVDDNRFSHVGVYGWRSLPQSEALGELREVLVREEETLAGRKRWANGVVEFARNGYGAWVEKRTGARYMLASACPEYVELQGHGRHVRIYEYRCVKVEDSWDEWRKRNGWEPIGGSGIWGRGPYISTNQDDSRHRRIDLMPLIVPQQHAVSGQWALDAVRQGGRREAQVTSDRSRFARLGIPYKPPAEYDVKVCFTVLSGNDAIVVCCYAGGRQVLWEMNSWGRQECGWSTDTPHRSSASWFRPGVRQELIIKVRRQLIESWVDGVCVYSYPTNYAELDVYAGWWLWSRECLGIGSQESATVFHSIELTEISGPGCQLNFNVGLGGEGNAGGAQRTRWSNDHATWSQQSDGSWLELNHLGDTWPFRLAKSCREYVELHTTKSRRNYAIRIWEDRCEIFDHDWEDQYRLQGWRPLGGSGKWQR